MDATQPLLFQGTLLNQQGAPVEGARVQMWQTDLDGNYLHSLPSARPVAPQLDEHASIVSDFQYFGSDTTDGTGNFDFLTYRPGIYPARPYSHFHVMVWLTGEDATPALVTQFYFSDESPPFPEELHLDITAVDESIYGFGGYVNGTMVVADPSIAGEAVLPVSPTQPQGPFYPEVDFFSIDNDLTTDVPMTTTMATTAASATTIATSMTVATSTALAATDGATTRPVNPTESPVTNSAATTNCSLLVGFLAWYVLLSKHLLACE